jgi:hypothetical protein
MRHDDAFKSVLDDRDALDNHPVYAAVGTLQDLRVFMEHHVYSVWDFMSLIKYLQAQVAPATFPWLPGSDTEVTRFINELVMEEESDLIPVSTGTEDQQVAKSHFELYCSAMQEIGADPSPALAFVDAVRHQGINKAIRTCRIPSPSREFMKATFAFIDTGKPHIVAAALALGREHIIPGMFRSLLKRIGISENAAPMFHYYLKRHVHLDADFHAPLSLRLVNKLCDNREVRFNEATAAAHEAVRARLRLWDGVLQRLEQRAA